MDLYGPSAKNARTNGPRDNEPRPSSLVDVTVQEFNMVLTER